MMQSLPSINYSALIDNSQLIKAYKDQPLFIEGEEIKGIYFIQNGSVKMTKLNDNKTPSFLWLAKEKELLGISSYYHGDGSYDCSAINSSTENEVRFIPLPKFKGLLQEQGSLQLGILNMLCDRVKFIEKRTIALLYENADDRIVATLILLATPGNPNAVKGIQNRWKLNYPKEELALIAGVSFTYFRRRIKLLKEKNLITYGKNWLVILDINKFI